MCLLSLAGATVTRPSAGRTCVRRLEMVPRDIESIRVAKVDSCDHGILWRLQTCEQHSAELVNEACHAVTSKTYQSMYLFDPFCLNPIARYQTECSFFIGFVSRDVIDIGILGENGANSVSSTSLAETLRKYFDVYLDCDYAESLRHV